MKKANKLMKNKATKVRKPISAVDKASMIRRATHITLKEYSQTFADLARYDRTEKTHG